VITLNTIDIYALTNH